MSDLPPHLAALAGPPPQPAPAAPPAANAPAVDRTDPGRADAFEVLVELRALRVSCALCTVVGASGSSPRKLGAKMVVTEAGATFGTIGGGAVEHRVIAEALAAIASGAPRRSLHHLTKDLGMCCGGSMEVFIEPQLAAPRLCIFGAGHVAKPLAAVAALAGFEVTVLDARPEWATPERFPDATVRCEDPEAALGALPIDDDTFVVIVTHDHALDERVLASVLSRSTAYVGVIGSQRKREKFRQRLRGAGFDDEAVSRFRTPMGVDIGAITAEEIAVSVVAELIQVRRARAGDSPADRVREP